MADLREVWAWIVFYLITSIFAFMAALFIMNLFWPSYDASEQSSGPLEQQFYLLLADRGYWMTGKNRDSEFGEGMSEKGRERFARLLNDIRFKRDCLDGADKKNKEEMECTVNGEWIYFVN
ncbi:hypothetical protein [Herbaspirillum sp. alder98]|uniref:hypothetical protein n=1 Tax=Herbaspirillum sp. alder98 TaxID=2913096 RepID=UPI001CD837DC|nr:hypothetical protein [Herbaspirillum sp. alder98]MCA1326354.1 hypothetical protein [Herbaspirillum sp. alder98]